MYLRKLMTSPSMEEIHVESQHYPNSLHSCIRGTLNFAFITRNFNSQSDL